MTLPSDGEHAILRPRNSRRTRARREADRAQQADLARALLDAEPEEQRREQQRRHDEEEAEVGEVLAEVGGAARRGQARRARTSRDRQPERQRIDRGAQRAPRSDRARRSRDSPPAARTRTDVRSP